MRYGLGCWLLDIGCSCRSEVDLTDLRQDFVVGPPLLSRRSFRAEADDGAPFLLMSPKASPSSPAATPWQARLRLRLRRGKAASAGPASRLFLPLKHPAAGRWPGYAVANRAGVRSFYECCQRGNLHFCVLSVLRPSGCSVSSGALGSSRNLSGNNLLSVSAQGGAPHAACAWSAQGNRMNQETNLQDGK